MQATRSHGIDWFVGGNGNLFGDCGGFRYCVARLSSGEYLIARDGIHIAHAPSVAEAKLIIKRRLPMTAAQFSTALDRLKLSQLGAARLFQSNDRTVRRWAIGERSVPVSVAILLRLMLSGKLSTTDVEGVR